MNPRLTWVNHASFLLASGSTRLLTDPWLFGSAFNRGWDLLSPSALRPEDFADISHIWFSHEHPDHFAPPVLAAIPESSRRRIEVLYQRTPDRRVVSFCRELGFHVRELADGEWLELDPAFRILCGRVPFYDSWLLAEIDGVRVLDFNDCEPPSAESLQRIAEQTGPIQVLATQFSYANRVGDVAEPEKRRRAAREKLERVEAQIAAFAPRFVILAASYVWFSHEENGYLNDGMNTPEAAARFVAERTSAQPIVLYPGDEWDLRSPRDCSDALDRYAADRRKVAVPLHRSETVPFDELRSLAAAYRSRMAAQNNRLLVWLASSPILPLLPRLTVHLPDLDRVVTFDLRRGLREVDTSPERADLSTASENLAFVFRHDFGGDTLYVNGRFVCPTGQSGKVLRAFALGTLNNTGRRLGFSLLWDRRFLERAVRVLFLRPRFLR